MESPPRKLNWLLLLAVLLIGLALGGELFRRMRRAAPPPEPTRAIRPPASSPRTPELIHYDDLLDMLAGPAGTRAAERVTAALMNDPRLRRAWERLVRESPGRPKGRLLEELADDSGFEALLEQLQKDPEFRKELGPALRELDRAGRSGALAASPGSVDGSRMLVLSQEAIEEGSRPRAGERRAAGLGAARAQAPSPSSGRDSRFAAAAGAAALRGAGAAGLGGGGARASGAGAAGGVDTGGRRSGVAGRSAARQAAGGEATVPLAALSQAQSAQMAKLLEQYPFLTQLSDQDRSGVLEHTDEDGMWGACFRDKVYKKCLDACKRAGGACQEVSGWRACLDFTNGDQARCVGLCAQQPGCQVPPGIAGAGGAGGTGGGACNQLCGPWQPDSGCGGGGCGPKQRFRTRACPPTAGCSQDDCWSDGSGCEN